MIKKTDNVIEKIEQYKIVPVVTIQKIEDADGVLSGLVSGNLPVAEICFRTDCAEDAIKFAVRKYPDMLIGAGTVINAMQCERAISVGAEFIVSPGLSEDIARVCKERNVTYFPGVVTPAEIIKAISLGLTHLKFFPAGSFGGLNTVKALSAAFPQVKFMPTGGVNLENLNEYLFFPQVFACGGSWMVKDNKQKTEEKTRAAVSAVHAIKTIERNV